MEKHFHKEFKQCPCCGCEDRFFEQLAQTLKDRGLARKEWHFHKEMKQGVVMDQTKVDAIPIGSEIPGYGFKTDICMNCGCVYATDLTRNDAKKSVDVSHVIPPHGGKLPLQPFSKS